MASKRTNSCKKKRNVFFILSTLCWVGTAIVVVICALSKVENKTTIDLLSQSVKDKLIAFSTTAIIGLILSLFIKDKARTTIYMLSLIVGTILWHDVAMYTILGIWALDEYVLHTLYKSYAIKVKINKEIDLR